MKAFVLIVIIAVAGLVALLVGDYMYVNAGTTKDLIKYSGWLSTLGIVVVIVGFY